MNILVTGGAGFIGSHVADAYVAAGHRVTVVDNLSTGRRAQVNPRARFVKADIRSSGMARLFARGRFDVVNHHAAQMDVRRSVADPLFDADVNIRGLLNVLECCRTGGVKKVIFAASGGTYYGECPRPAGENTPPRPLSPYGISKLAGEHYLRAYRALHGLRFTALRYGNVYGPRQDPHGEAGVVAIFCNRLLKGDPVTIFGTGRQKRDYVYVEDVARANRLALTRGDDEAVNIGTGRAASVLDLYRLLNTASGRRGECVFQPARTGELFKSCLRVEKAARLLGWTARVPLSRGLADTYRWMAER